MVALAVPKAITCQELVEEKWKHARIGSATAVLRTFNLDFWSLLEPSPLEIVTLLEDLTNSIKA